jgi:hypothetical protein
MFNKMNVSGEATVATASWQRMVTSIALCVFASISAQAQSIEFTQTHLFMGQPLDLELRVRFDSTLPHQPLSPDCIQVQIYQGEAQAAEELHVHLQPMHPPGASRVARLQLQGHQQLQEPWIQGRLSLHCGAAFTREFTLLVNPAPATMPLGAPTTAARKTLRRVQTPTPPPKHISPLQRPTALPAALTPADMADLQRSQQHLMRLITALEDRLEAQERAREPRENIDQAAANPGPLPKTTTRSSSPKDWIEGWDQLLWVAVIGVLAFLWGRYRITPHEHLLPPATTTPAVQAAAVPSSRNASLPPPQPPSTTTTRPAVTELPRNISWPIEAGEPSLDKPELDVPLSTLDQAAADGYLGATLAVLETALQVRRSKSADLLLRLLDGYEALQQPMNRARVASQLEALYNVDTAAATHPSLDETAHPMAASLVSAWQQTDRTSALAHLLLEKNSPLPVLDLTAFREILWLHHLSLEEEASESVPALGLAVLH